MQKAGTFDPADLPPVLPGWLQDVWRLYELLRTQWRGMGGGLDYNVAIELIRAERAMENLWQILELLQVVEVEVMKAEEKPSG